MRFDRTPGKTAKAKRLREQPSNAERLLWAKLRSAQIAGQSFRRQHPVGPYVLDFYCARLRLAIEVDGSQHDRPDHRQRDDERDDWLLSRGIRVIRFPNSEVLDNADGVAEAIRLTCLALDDAP